MRRLQSDDEYEMPPALEPTFVRRIEIVLERPVTTHRQVGAIPQSCFASPLANMSGNYFGIGIFNAKTADNVGTLWRSAYQLGASFIFTVGERSRVRTNHYYVDIFTYAGMQWERGQFGKQSSDTVKAWRYGDEVASSRFLDTLLFYKVNTCLSVGIVG